MSFPPATEMFQFAGFASYGYGFTARYLLRGGLPHSEIPGSKGARASPGLFAACHVLHRLSTPRHSPDALRSLAPLQQRAPSCTTGSPFIQQMAEPPTVEADGRTATPCCSETSAPMAKSERPKTSIPCLKDRPIPDHDSNGEPPLPQSGMDELMRPTQPNAAADEGRTPDPHRRSIALPAFDQTCLFTMYKEHPPDNPTGTASAATDHRRRGNHVTSLSPSDITRTSDEWPAHAIGVVGLG